MATENPTGDGRVVSLSIPTGKRDFLHRVVNAARDGIREELDRYGDQLRAPKSALLLEETAYAALLGALDLGRIAPDVEIQTTLKCLAESIDRENEYERVCFEHDALHDLLGQIEGSAGE